MTGLLELKEKLKQIYGKYEAFILPILKFILGFAVFNTINGRLGYMGKLDNIAIVLIVALACSVLPMGIMVFLAAVFCLLHLYALSLETAIVGFSVFLIMYLLYLRFGPKDSLVVLLTPLLFVLKIPYVLPVAVGLLCAPTAVVSMSCGIVVYYFLHLVVLSAPTIKTMGADEMTPKIRLLIDGLLGDKAILVFVVAFTLTVLIVYFIRRLSLDHAWTIAMIAGAIFNVVALLGGDLAYDINISVGVALLESVLAIGVGKVIEFFRFCVDYNRTERVQFEDDEYYYYVKAVPKMSVSAPTKTVKRINPQNVGHPASDRNSRSVVVERTGGNPIPGGDNSRGRRMNRERNATSRQSITVGSVGSEETEDLDY